MPWGGIDLAGKVALVTGGNKGLGLAMARGLAEAGADLVLASRRSEDLAVATAAVQQGSPGRKVVGIPFDAAQRASVRQLADEALTQFGTIDILINNAGMNAPEGIDEITDETWDRVLEVNLSSVMALTRALVPGMKSRGWGRIIHISSIFGLVSKERRNAYSASKAALLGMMRASAIELGPLGITVNAIAPGPFLTDMPRSVLSAAEQAAFAAQTCLNRWAAPEELVGPCLLLASPAGSFITGQTLIVDGGYTTR